ncbi:MAG: glycosyltransferase [Candidatus Staskawiczbacteria bacterium]|nr:glycosyltransferase [Candidatus Staskawiczbacteria bacterium]
MNKKKVLIISMTGGFGHIRAGTALLDYAKQHLPNIEAEHIDAIEIDPPLKKYAVTVYGFISKKFPFLWKVIYGFTLFSLVMRKVVALRGMYNHNIKNYIIEKKPEAVICTNVVILPIIAPILHKVLPATKIGVVITDYCGHPYYNIAFVDYYFVPTLQVQKELEEAGVVKEKIVVTGIPIDPRFYIKENIQDLKLKYGIKNNLPIVLFIASFKISKNDLRLVIGQLLKLTPNINLIFIASGNEEFYTLAKNNFEGQERFLLVKWTNTIDEYMKLSSVVISKAGGLTVSECINLQKPLIMVNPIPGQEEYNAQFVVKNNLGVKVNNISEIIAVVSKIILSSRNKQINLLEQQNSCEKIFKAIL